MDEWQQGLPSFVASLQHRVRLARRRGLGMPPVGLRGSTRGTHTEAAKTTCNLNETLGEHSSVLGCLSEAVILGIFFGPRRLFVGKGRLELIGPGENLPCCWRESRLDQLGSRWGLTHLYERRPAPIRAGRKDRSPQDEGGFYPRTELCMSEERQS